MKFSKLRSLLKEEPTFEKPSFEKAIRDFDPKNADEVIEAWKEAQSRGLDERAFILELINKAKASSNDYDSDFDRSEPSDSFSEGLLSASSSRRPISASSTARSALLAVDPTNSRQVYKAWAKASGSKVSYEDFLRGLVEKIKQSKA